MLLMRQPQCLLCSLYSFLVNNLFIFARASGETKKYVSNGVAESVARQATFASIAIMDL